jgi:proteasome assembly chaperone (PAC2) family protein
MSPTKKWLLIVLVTASFLMTGFGGLRDMYGVSLFGASKEHSWNDGMFLMLAAILVAVLPDNF